MANSPPVATINDQTIKFDKSANVVNWLTYSDADGNPATKYQFWDSGAATNSGYFSAPGVIHHPANTTLEVTASNLSKVKVHGGAVGGSETLWVRAFDGTDWGAWDTFTLTTLPNATPVATISDHAVQTNASANVLRWLTYSDADGDHATKYQFWDSGAAADSGYFSAPGVAHHPANTTLEVTASNLSKVKVHGGAVGGSETLWVRAFDGRDWGAWDTFTLTSRLPIVGTNLPDLIDGSHTPLGQPLPSVESDFIYGLGGADTLFGLDGIDTLTGGLGKDILVGGLDADIFDFNRKSESTPANRDVIGDFSGTGAELDRIDLSGIDAKAGHGNQSFHWIGPHKFHHRVGELQVKYNDLSDVAIVSGDIDGNGRADFQIEVYSAVALAKGDFIL